MPGSEGLTCLLILNPEGHVLYTHSIRMEKLMRLRVGGLRSQHV